MNVTTPLQKQLNQGIFCIGKVHIELVIPLTNDEFGRPQDTMRAKNSLETRFSEMEHMNKMTDEKLKVSCCLSGLNIYPSNSVCQAR